MGVGEGVSAESAFFLAEILREPFLRYALVAVLLAGSVCAFLGVYVILRRIVFLGVALSEAAALGVALGLFLGWNPEAAASGLTLLTALLLSLAGRYRALSQESLIGWAYVVAAGSAIILIAKNLERVGDHATNIAEEVIFLAEARIVRHQAKLGTQSTAK